MDEGGVVAPERRPTRMGVLLTLPLPLPDVAEVPLHGADAPLLTFTRWAIVLLLSCCRGRAQNWPERTQVR